MLARMRYLEKIDARDRADGTPHEKRLRQVPPETGKLIAMLAAGAPSGAVVEIGTSAGYSTMWLALACRERQKRGVAGARVIAHEINPAKVALARETFRIAGVEDLVELVEGDARKSLAHVGEVAFCFLDAEKDVYADCYDLIVPRMVKGGLIAADNVISHRESLQPWVDRVLADSRVDAVVVPIGQGVLVCRAI
jgi:predicted O-methyltransferase YrrM